MSDNERSSVYSEFRNYRARILTHQLDPKASLDMLRDILKHPNRAEVGRFLLHTSHIAELLTTITMRERINPFIFYEILLYVTKQLNYLYVKGNRLRSVVINQLNHLNNSIYVYLVMKLKSGMDLKRTFLFIYSHVKIVSSLNGIYDPGALTYRYLLVLSALNYPNMFRQIYKLLKTRVYDYNLYLYSLQYLHYNIAKFIAYQNNFFETVIPNQSSQPLEHIEDQISLLLEIESEDIHDEEDGFPIFTRFKPDIVSFEDMNSLIPQHYYEGFNTFTNIMENRPITEGVRRKRRQVIMPQGVMSRIKEFL